MVGGRVVDADRSLLDQAQHLGGRHGLADAGDLDARVRRQGDPMGVDPRRPDQYPAFPTITAAEMPPNSSAASSITPGARRRPAH